MGGAKNKNNSLSLLLVVWGKLAGLALKKIAYSLVQEYRWLKVVTHTWAAEEGRGKGNQVWGQRVIRGTLRSAAHISPASHLS